jgi:hypothetical protein
MLKKLVNHVVFYAFSTLNLIYAYRALKREVVKLAETPKATNKFHYVAIRLARGDYNNVDGIETMTYDYKFYDIATKFHD